MCYISSLTGAVKKNSFLIMSNLIPFSSLYGYSQNSVCVILEFSKIARMAAAVLVDETCNRKLESFNSVYRPLHSQNICEYGQICTWK